MVAVDSQVAPPELAAGAACEELCHREGAARRLVVGNMALSGIRLLPAVEAERDLAALALVNSASLVDFLLHAAALVRADEEPFQVFAICNLVQEHPQAQATPLALI